MGNIDYILRTIIKCLILLYRWMISPILGPSCRFDPSCSQYALQALEKHGFMTGLLFIMKRLLRCHPACNGGYDPVPSNKKEIA